MRIKRWGQLGLRQPWWMWMRHRMHRPPMQPSPSAKPCHPPSRATPQAVEEGGKGPRPAQ